jgi:hypothetical protein
MGNHVPSSLDLSIPAGIISVKGGTPDLAVGSLNTE